MSAGYRPTKADLIAIYRLEFYRKQKNWKLSQDKRRDVSRSKVEKTDSATSKSTLNQTYDVDYLEMEESPLNEAFVESGSDKNSQLPDSPKEINELRSENFYGNKRFLPPKLIQNSTLPEKDQILPETWNPPELHTNPGTDWPECNLPQKQWFNEQIWSGVVKESCPEPDWSHPESGWSDPDFVGVEKEPVEELWSNLANNYHEAAFTTDKEQLGGSSWAVLSAAVEDWCRANGAPRGRGDDLSLDSVSEFTRGAHCAPHSSEMELRLPTGAASDMSLAHMPNGALRGNIFSHMYALRALLKEAQRRDELSSPPSYDSLELPTRDVGLPADFLAGSHRAGAGRGPTGGAPAGRGRGRLHAVHLIGIGGGRPFRL